MSKLHKVLAFTLSSLLIVGVGLALWNRISKSSDLARKVLGGA